MGTAAPKPKSLPSFREVPCTGNETRYRLPRARTNVEAREEETRDVSAPSYGGAASKLSSVQRSFRPTSTLGPLPLIISQAAQDRSMGCETLRCHERGLR